MGEKGHGLEVAIENQVKLYMGESREEAGKRLRANNTRFDVIFDEHLGEHREAVVELKVMEGINILDKVELQFKDNELIYMRASNSRFNHIMEVSKEDSAEMVLSKMMECLRRVLSLDGYNLKIESLNFKTMQGRIVIEKDEERYRLTTVRDANDNMYINTIHLLK